MSDNSPSIQENDISSIEPSKTSEVRLESNVIESIRFYDKQEESSFNINESNEIVLKVEEENFGVESGNASVLESVSEDAVPPTPFCTPNTDSEAEEYFEVDLSTYQEDIVKHLDFDDVFYEPDKDVVVSTSLTNSTEEKSNKSVDENEWEPVECLQYAEIPDFANTFVSDIIQTSLEIIKLQKNLSYTDENVPPPVPQTPKVNWPRVGEFTKELGETAIMRYMGTWEYKEKWLYCVDFLIAESDDYSDYFVYEAKWSIPTYAYPVPQATASIFFTIEVSKLKPPFCPVDVSYVFEGTRLVRKPGKIPFNEDYLSDIVDSKLCLYKCINFYLMCF